MLILLRTVREREREKKKRKKRREREREYVVPSFKAALYFVFFCSQPFKVLVPPIPVFDKLNDTYSQGQV